MNTSINFGEIRTAVTQLRAQAEDSLQRKALSCYLKVLTALLDEHSALATLKIEDEKLSQLLEGALTAEKLARSIEGAQKISELIISFLREDRAYVATEIKKECSRLLLKTSRNTTDYNSHLSEFIGNLQSQLSVLIVGGGASGLSIAYELRLKGIPYYIVDSNTGPGGCWRTASYPGARTDVANMMYALSFLPNPKWQEVYSTQPSMLSYLTQGSLGLFDSDRIAYSTRLLTVKVHSRGLIEATLLNQKTGKSSIKRYAGVVFATGQLSKPYYPREIKGVFPSGGCSHTGSGIFPDINLMRKVAIVGSAASAVQLANQLSGHNIEVDIYSRSHSWFYDVPHYRSTTSSALQVLFEHLPLFKEIFRLVAHSDAIFGNLQKVKLNPDGSPTTDLLNFKETLTNILCRWGLENYIPRYMPGEKRILVDDGSLAHNILEGKVKILKNAVRSIFGKTIEIDTCGQHRFHTYDHIFLATGYITDSFVGGARVEFNGGALDKLWLDRPYAYCGVVIPEVPSVYIMYGPNTNGVVNGNIFWFIERQAEIIAKSISQELSGERESSLSLDAKRNMEEFLRIVDRGNSLRSWGQSVEKGWYRHKSGKSVQNWPFSLAAYGSALEDFDSFKRLDEVNEH